MTDLKDIFAEPQATPPPPAVVRATGEAVVDLRFEGRDTSLSVEVLRRSGDIDVVVRL